MQINSPFDVLGTITSKEVLPREVVEEHLNIFLLLNYLRSNQVGLSIANYLNHNWKIPLYDAYLFALHALPKQITFIKWTKVDKPKEDKDILAIRMYYVCNEVVAEDYKKIISKNGLKYIKRYYPNEFKGK